MVISILCGSYLLELATSPRSTAKRNFFSAKVRTPICWCGGRSGSGECLSILDAGALRLWLAMGARHDGVVEVTWKYKEIYIKILKLGDMYAF